MAENILVPIFVVGMLFIGLPWLIFHYVTKWKTAATITNEDEDLLDNLYHTARRLDERMDTIERIIAADNPDWKPSRLEAPSDTPEPTLQDIEKLIKERRPS